MADFFISYTGRDRPWAEWIAWQLEDQGLTTILQAWDFAPGTDFVRQMQQAVATASQTIAVLSWAYVRDSPYGEAEWRIAFAKDPSGEKGKLIPVRVEEVDPPELLSTRVYIDLFDKDARAARNLLLASVSKGREGRTKPDQEPQFPGPRYPGALPRIVGVGRQASRYPAVFVLDVDGSLRWRRQNPDWHWDRWRALGGNVTGSVGVARNRLGILEILAIGTDGQAWLKRQKAWETPDAWSDWSQLGLGATGSRYKEILLTSTRQVNLGAFALADDGHVYHRWQEWPVENSWSPWRSLDGSLESGLATSFLLDRRLELFALGQDKAVYHCWQKQDLSWSEWESLAGYVAGPLAVARNRWGANELFALGTDGEAYHRWRQSDGRWAGWVGAGGQLVGELMLRVDQRSRLHLFALGKDGTVQHIWQHLEDHWSEWGSLGGEGVASFRVCRIPDGRMELYAVWRDGTLWHRWQNFDWTWSEWTSFE